MPVDRLLRAYDADAVVLESGRSAISRDELSARVGKLAAAFRQLRVTCIALHADNGIDWIVADLASLGAGIRMVPVPLFFSPGQVRHVLASAGADLLLTDQPVPQGDVGARPAPALAAAGRLDTYSLPERAAARVPGNTQKITYTSGTTGAPKGACLSAAHLLAVAQSVARATGLGAPRHLCVLPLSTLLENVAGVYAPLLAGGTVVVPPLADVGIDGSSSLAVDRLLTCVSEQRPNSLILVPEVLRALTIAAECSWRPPSSLHFVAVGGGKVAPDLLARARHAGLPVYEGYGLSECGSVVALNVPGRDRIGAVGQPLPHLRIRIEQGEIVVAGSAMLGYVDRPESFNGGEIRTGDLGHQDDDGFIHIDGRAKNQFITSFGRNISPEWVESELLAGSLLRQAVVIGDARPWCVALLQPSDPRVSDADIDAWLRRSNQRLPDYARIVDWQRLPEPLTAGNGTLTDNGRPRRAAIDTLYRSLIENLYAQRAEAGNQ